MWGSDIFLYRALPDHEQKILKIASLIDGYHAECARDIGIIKQMGFRRFFFPPLPATGGTSFDTFPALATLQKPSQRKDIVLKGYHGWAGRALHILSAVHLVSDALRGYTLRITLAGPEVREMAKAMTEADDLNIVIEPYAPEHREALLRLANARAVVGLGISDGISTTLLEAMTVGAFPIQGSCSCGNEWITPGETGFLVNPHDIRSLARCLERVASDDDLVDRAALINRATVEQRWNSTINSRIALQSYHQLLDGIPLEDAARAEPDAVEALHE
jgi:glycosyltransferase involved in cell wall biosynthesis